MNTSAEPSLHSELEIGHVLFMDVVGYSRLLNNEQREMQKQIVEIVRGTEHFRAAEAADKLLRLPTGDGMALAFFNSPEAPVYCACEISEALKNHPGLKLRMGIHSGPVSGVIDVNDRSNIAGAGINTAQRVMDCGDAGHILLSQRAADDLVHDGRWRPYLHNLGRCEVKHGVHVSVVNLYKDGVGNTEIPERIKKARRTETIAIRRRLFLGGAVALIMALGVAALLYPHRTVPMLSKTVAVLPLENLSDEKENAYLADGIQDELLSNLAKIKELKVISRTSVMQYKSGVTRNLKEIAQQLGVSNVVEGSVRRSGNHVRVSIQLIDALNDHHIWAEVYDRTLADSVTLQGELATLIAAGVGATLSPQEKARVEATPTKNTAAYEAYLRGRAYGASGTDLSHAEKAIRSYEEAVKLDPTFALAWTYLSRARSFLYWTGEDPSPALLVAAKEAVDRAVALDANLPETHLALGFYYYYGRRNYADALAEFERAEQGLPNNVDVLMAIGLLHRRLAHWDRAIAEMRRAVELDPHNLYPSSALSDTYGAVRGLPEMIATADRILAMNSTNAEALWTKAIVAWARGDVAAVEPLLANPGAEPFIRGVQALFQRRYTTANEIFLKLLLSGDPTEKLWGFFRLGLGQQREGDTAAAAATGREAVEYLSGAIAKAGPESFVAAEMHSCLGLIYADLGDAASAIAEGKKGMAIQPASEDPFEGPTREEEMAMIYALLGDADHAIPILQRLTQLSYAGFTGVAITPGLLRIDPVWDKIRSDLRFRELAAETKP